MENATAQPLPRQERPSFWRRHPFLRVALLAVAAFLVLFAAVVFLGGRIDLARARKAARDKGYALTLAEIAARTQPLPDERNAALLYDKALKLFEYPGREQDVPRFVPGISTPKSDTRSGDPAILKAAADMAALEENQSQPMPDYMLTAAKTLLSNQTAAFEIVRNASSIPESRYNDSTDLEEWLSSGGGANRYSRGLAFGSLALALAAWVDAEEGRSADAAARILDATALIRSFAQSTVRLSSGFAGSGFVVEPTGTSLVWGLKHVLSRADLSDAELAELQRQVAALAEQLSARPLLEARLAALSEQCDRTLALVPDRYFRGGRASWYLPRISGHESYPVFDVIPFWMVGAPVRKDTAAAMQFVTALLDQSRSASPDFFRLPPPPPYRRGVRGGPLLEEAYGFLYGTLLCVEADRARLRCAAVAIACLRYRNQSGKWPANLETLVPQYVDAVPMDPFSNTTVRYLSGDKRVMVYSVGVDGVDNGASEAFGRASSYSFAATSDFPFVIER